MKKENDDEENVQYISRKAEILILVGFLCIIVLEVAFFIKLFS